MPDMKKDMKRIIGKWQYGINFGICPTYMAGFHPYIDIWFLKLKHVSPEGEILQKCCYSGILFRKQWNPIIIMRIRTFKIFGKYKRIIYPIKIQFNPHA